MPNNYSQLLLLLPLKLVATSLFLRLNCATERFRLTVFICCVLSCKLSPILEVVRSAFSFSPSGFLRWSALTIFVRSLSLNVGLHMTVINRDSPGKIVPTAGEKMSPEFSGSVKQKEIGPVGKTGPVPIRGTGCLNSSPSKWSFVM